MREIRLQKHPVTHLHWESSVRFESVRRNSRIAHRVDIGEGGDREAPVSRRIGRHLRFGTVQASFGTAQVRCSLAMQRPARINASISSNHREALTLQVTFA